MAFKPLPIGIDNFQEMIEKGYYYVDKTLFIKELLDMKGKVNLFTRPRRFGKTLNMNMLQCFFERGYCDAERIFQGLKIMGEGENYTRQMSQYPVIALSLKSMKQATYELSYIQMKKIIAGEFRRHDAVLQSDKLTESEKKRFQDIRDVRGEEADYLDALEFLSGCMFKCYDQKCLILIDEYDVPLESSYFGGFYDRMVPVIRSLFESALKTNENLEFAVITGCLRISKESIFTGLNNLKIVSITNPVYAEHFGFTEKEVMDMLKFYDRTCCMDIAKKWYDGYLFGKTEVYNPWSVVNYVEQAWVDVNTFPQPFWSNTSSNSIVRTLVERADIRVRQELESLIQGDSIEKPIHEDITYEDIGADKTQDNLWNFLFFTGYLKKTQERVEGNVRYISMAIPNEEVKYIYKNTILGWFDQTIRKKDLSPFYKSIIKGDAAGVEKTVTEILREGISFYDTRESFYHGFILGLLKGMKDYYVYSNREAGDGRYDICLKSLDVMRPAVILELKSASSFGEMEAKSLEAISQIEMKHYEQELVQDGYQKVLCYGIAFYKKNCRVAVTEVCSLNFR
ncbi:ATP-binding protein [Faecalicatena sp. AGMB00832]|uniref:ATP-binding protein n=1 Tax=Faecalicatena faecalis TaxID=2726362 RepID=A0ABS6D975_9FIRM|nr:AAA family ATPase [Faecalicatena faecalis]MBU3877752.1 ATP-binding protein [Faecalicatena faecalis]